MKKRISVPFLAAVVVVLIAVIVIVKPFPQKASAVFPEKLLELSCTVARESVDSAERRDLTDAQKEALLNETPEVTYPKGFHLFLANRKSSKFYLMKKGMLHAYTYKSDKKVTFWFGKEGDAIFPLQTLYNNQAGYENIELLEDSVLYELSVDKLHDLYLADIHIANWGRKFAERECIKSEQLFISRQFKTSLERYQDLIADYPDILQRVPLGIIASYLGISQVSLSRIRAKIR